MSKDINSILGMAFKDEKNHDKVIKELSTIVLDKSVKFVEYLTSSFSFDDESISAKAEYISYWNNMSFMIFQFSSSISQFIHSLSFAIDQEIIPLYFQLANYASFVRELPKLIWGKYKKVFKNDDSQEKCEEFKYDEGLYNKLFQEKDFKELKNLRDGYVHAASFLNFDKTIAIEELIKIMKGSLKIFDFIDSIDLYTIISFNATHF